jgi:hypothetical protein
MGVVQIVLSWLLWAGFVFAVVQIDLSRQRKRAIAANDDLYLEPDVSALVYISLLLCIPISLPIYFAQARKDKAMGVLIGIGWGLVGFVVVAVVLTIIRLVALVGGR